MAYVKPGVQVTQKQQTISPTLIAPDLPAVIIGPSYRVVEIAERTTNFTHDYGVRLGPTTTDINLFSGVTFDTTALSNLANNTNLIYVDIVGATASSIGQTLHIPPGHASVTLSTNTITITKTMLSGITTPDLWVSGFVKVGWRTLDTSLVGQMVQIESQTDVEGLIGKRVPENPAGFGASIAINNAGTAIYAVTMSGTDSDHHDDSLDLLSSQEVYAIGPVLPLTAAIAANYAAHTTARSTPTEKMERIAFGNITRTITGTASTDATTIAASNLSFANKRFFSVHPHVGYYTANRHVSTVYPSYLNAMNDSALTGIPAILEERIETSTTTYYKGQAINTAVWSGISSVRSFVFASVPITGAYWCAAAAGQVAGNVPQQGLTNLPVAGNLSRVKYSNDYFSQTNLNTIAAGGTYIIHQNSPASVPTCRHQLSTDMSSVETRELSITKTVDFVSKYLRNALISYIGRYNITSQFLSLVGMTLDGLRQNLIRDGIVTDMNILSITQSTTERDNLLVSIEIAVPYPCNYIKITLAF